MKIIKYTINDLKNELLQGSLWSKNVFPITKQRVLSYINNPNADGNDVVLFVAYHKDTIIGYIGVLPDRIYLSEVEHKIAWATSWWVDPSHRYVGTGGFLLLTVLNHHILATSRSTEDAEKVFSASNRIFPMRKVAGIELIVRCCSNHLIPKKFPKLNWLRPVLTCIDRLVNVFGDLRLFFWRQKNAAYKTASIEFITELDEQTDQFIRDHRRNELSTRNAKELNWIMKYPWIISSPVADKTVKKYFFSSVSNRFFYLNIKVYDTNDTMTGFLMLKVKNNTMTIPYLYCDPSALTPILYLIGFLICEMNIDIFTTYNIDIMNNFDQIRLPFLYKKNRINLYHLSNKFKEVDFNEIVIQDGDGDCVFT